MHSTLDQCHHAYRYASSMVLTTNNREDEEGLVFTAMMNLRGSLKAMKHLRKTSFGFRRLYWVDLLRFLTSEYPVWLA